MKKGLVMEGGSMRGLFTAGVMDVFLENNIVFDGSIGVSAGAAFGCNYKSKQIGRVLRYTKRFCRYWKFCSVRSWLFTGNIFGAEFCYYDIPFKLDVFDFDTFKNNPMDFYIVATDVRTGKAVYHNMNDYADDNIEWLRASASLPALSKPVKIGDALYLDGGMGDSIPLEYMQKNGYEKNIVILTQPEGFVKEQLKVLPLIKLFTHKHPAVAQALKNRPDMYNAQTAYVKECEDNGNTLVIRPEEALNIGSRVSDPEELQRVYDIGRQTALKRIEEVKSFMAD
ncbi:MAG: patatin family protein [Clostridiales bacterium]|nr:patatin family protein [Clostridiales bacterium]